MRLKYQDRESILELLYDGYPSRAKGKALDRIAECYGLQRKKRLWVFKERDKTLRQRISKFLRKIYYDVGSC